MKKYFYILLALLIAALVFTACGPEAAPESKDYQVLHNDLSEGSLEISHLIPGEKFDFVSRYATDYNANEWHITDSKTLNMSAYLSPQFGVTNTLSTTTVLVEHVHIDATITSKYALMNGVLQDTMDDKLHVGDQPGFLVSDEYPYENIFAIEGYSEYLISGWGYYNQSYGYSTLDQIRLTEKNLVDRGGVNGTKFTVVYDLLIKYEGEEYFHTRSFVDEFVVPVSSGSTNNHLQNNMSSTALFFGSRAFATIVDVNYK